MRTLEVYQEYGDKLYFFILKRVKDREAANDILQNSFEKIHINLPKLRAKQKVKAWIFQIARNELVNYFDKETKYVSAPEYSEPTEEVSIQNCCCFDRFIDHLPTSNKKVIELVYEKGAKQYEAAEILGLSLANVKAIIRKSKDLLKDQFISCCKYELNTSGKLVGAADCAHCE